MSAWFWSSGKGHLRSRHVVLGLLEIAAQRLLVPDDAGILGRLGIFVVWHRARLSADQAVEHGTVEVGRAEADAMALHAFLEHFFARGDISGARAAASEHRQRQGAQQGPDDFHDFPPGNAATSRESNLGCVDALGRSGGIERPLPRIRPPAPASRSVRRNFASLSGHTEARKGGTVYFGARAGGFEF